MNLGSAGVINSGLRPPKKKPGHRPVPEALPAQNTSLPDVFQGERCCAADFFVLIEGDIQDDDRALAREFGGQEIRGGAKSSRIGPLKKGSAMPVKVDKMPADWRLRLTGQTRAGSRTARRLDGPRVGARAVSPRPCREIALAIDLARNSSLAGCLGHTGSPVCGCGKGVPENSRMRPSMVTGSPASNRVSMPLRISRRTPSRKNRCSCAA